MASTELITYQVGSNDTVLQFDNKSSMADNETFFINEEPVDLHMYAIIVPLLWGILTFVGALGNALVMYTLIRHGDKNATNYFVINLAVSDLSFLVMVVPTTATLYVLPEWIFGNVMCKITMYMMYVSIFCGFLSFLLYIVFGKGK